MGNDEDGNVFSDGFNSLHHGRLGFHVEGTRRFIEDEDICLAVECTGDADSLALPLGEPDSTFADRRVVALWQTGNEVLDLCSTSGFFRARSINLLDQRT